MRPRFPSPLSIILWRECLINALLTAATNLYAFYHDVIRQGLYIWEIEKMHKQYGLFHLPYYLFGSIYVHRPYC